MKKGLIGALVFFSAALISADIEVTVTAGRIEESDQTNPYHTIIIKAKDLEKASNLAEVLAQVPGLEIASLSGSTSGASFKARGFGENAFGRILILVDGQKLNAVDMAAPNLDSLQLSQVERIEVIQGGLGVPYGSGAVAAVINVITKKSTPGLRGQISLTGDTFWANQERGEVLGRFGDTSLGLGVFRLQNPGQRDRTASESLGGQFSLTQTLGKGSLGITLEAHKNENQLAGGISKAQYEANPNQAKNLSDGTKETGFHGAILGTFPGENLSFTTPGSYQLRIVNADYASYWPSGSFSDFTDHRFQLNPTLLLNLLNQEDVVVQLKAGADGTLNLAQIQKFSGADRQNQTYTASFIRWSGAPWAQVQVLKGEDWSWHFGGRWDLTHVEADGPGASALDDQVSYQNYALSAGVVWNPRPLRVWGNYSKVFRSPFLDEQLSYYWGDAFNKSLKAEEGHSFDLGLALNLQDLRVQLSGYTQLMDGEIQWDTPSSANKNLGTSWHYGGTLSARWSSPVFTADAALTHTRALLTNGTYSNKFIPLVSPWTAMVKGTFHLFEDAVEPWVSYQLSGGGYAGGDYSNTGETIPLIHLVNLGLDVQLKLDSPLALKFQVQGKNLLDLRTPDTVSYGDYYPRDGRSLQVSAGFKF